MAREIVVVAHRQEWKVLFAEAEVSLRKILEDRLLDVQHIGSTSVEGLSAKPTIDILAIVRDIDEIDGLRETMANHGFVAMGENGIPGRRYFYKTLPSNPFVETHHVHVYELGNPKYGEELLFRDFLRVDEATMRAYEVLKTALAVKYRHDPLSYTNAKSDFIVTTLDKARSYFGKAHGV